VQPNHRRHEFPSLSTPLTGAEALVEIRPGLATLADERPLLREALAGLRPDDSPLRAQLLVRLALAEAVASGSGVERERLCHQAADMARRLDDDELLAKVLDASRHVLWEPRDVDRQIATAREILRHAQAANVRELEIQARQWLVCDHLERGDIVAAEREMCRHAALARELRIPRHLWHALHWRAVRAHLAGRLDEAEALLREALATGRRIDNERARLHFAAGLFVVRRDQGRLKDLVDRLGPLPGRGRLPWAADVGRVLLHAEIEHFAEARIQLAALTADGLGGIPHEPGRLSALCALADASASVGDTHAAASLYEALLPYAGRNLVVGDAPMFQGSISRHLGRLASALGRGADAEAHLQRALAMHVRLRALPLQARTRLDLGTALARRDWVGDRARAVVHLTSAHALATSIGMRLVARQSTMRLASLRTRAGASALTPNAVRAERGQTP
jgi:tetratricopeptide (TPR) repeat protein